MILPKDTMVFPLFAEILKGSHWEGGDELKPERFLDEEGKVLRDEHLIPFSIGLNHKQCQTLNEN